jgi:hypothetical protein
MIALSNIKSIILIKFVFGLGKGKYFILYSLHTNYTKAKIHCIEYCLHKMNELVSAGFTDAYDYTFK